MFGQQKIFTWRRRKVLKWMKDIVVGTSVAELGLSLLRSPAQASKDVPLPYACPPEGVSAIKCLCPSPACSSNKDRTGVTYHGGGAFNICACPQTFITYGCCDASMQCYCSSE